MNDRRWLVVTALLFAMLGGLPAVYGQYVPATLDVVEREVAARYAAVRHLRSERLAGLLRGASDIIIFDVRDAAEYEVSHISGAVRVDPNVGSSAFSIRNGDKVSGKTVVFYCSVGVRSSKLAALVQDELTRAGAAAVYNLEGGIFRWHNEQRSLVEPNGAETPFVHPYNSVWGSLIERKTLMRNSP